MPLRRRLVRIAVHAALSVVLLFVATSAFVTTQQYLFRWRCERLLKDMQGIRLHQTTWAEAQKLMERWGKWGHFDGTCDATNCRYQIRLLDPGVPYSKLREDSPGAGFLRSDVFQSFYRLTGWRGGSFEIGFIVQDGTIWRTSSWFIVDLPPEHFLREENEPGSFLQLTARSRDALRDYSPHVRENWTLWPRAPIDDHPYYLVGRPSGCESCLSGEVNYDVQAPPEVVRKVTNYNFDCLTRRIACQTLEDMLPAAREWHLYEPPFGLPDNRKNPDPLGTCHTPLWAVGRDAATVLVVDALTSEHHSDEWEEFDRATAKLVGSLKNLAPWPSGTKVTVQPYLTSKEFWPAYRFIHLVPGHRYLAVVNVPLVEKQNASGQIHPIPPAVDLNHCDLFPDTPENRAELAKGFAMNDKLRVAEF